MKTRRVSRVLALALCLVLALSLMSGLTLRSEAEPAPVPEPASMETPEPEASEEPEATAEPTAEASEEPEPTEEPTPGPTEGEVDDETAEPSDAPEATEEPEVTEEPTDEPAAQEYACQSEGGVAVSASADPASGIPADAALHADEVAAGTEAYAKAYAAVWAQLGLGEGDELYILPFDVYFTDAAGGKIEPDSGLVQVTMTFATDPFAAVLAPAGTVGDPGVAEGPSFDGEMQPAPEMVTERLAVHILDDGAVETLTAETAEEGAVTFAVGSFSVMGPALVRRSAPAPMAADQTAVYVPTLPEGVEGASADTIEAAAALLAAEGGAIYLTGDVTMDTVAFDGKAVTVQSYGEGAAYTVTKNGTGENMFVLTNGAALTLANVTVNAANNVGGRTVTASGGAKLVLDAGAALTGNTAYGAVYLDGASIEIAGGVIRDNAAAGTASTKTWAPAPPNWTKDTVRYAYDVDLGEGQGLGGAILMVNGSAFAISSGEVSGNSALCGGAIYAWGGSSIKLSGGSVSNNTATGVDHTASGGAIAVDGGACAFTVNGAEIAGNSATQGGAFWFGIDTGKLDFTMTSGTIHGNSATDGSVAYFLGADSLIDISGSGSVIKGNTASGNGAFYVGKYPGNASSERAHFTVRDGATFSENKAAKGSCMYLTRDKGVNGLTLDGAVFTNNETTSDGGVLRYGVPESTFTVRNSTFTGNRTETNGGCFYVATDAQNSTFVFDGSVFKDNYAKNQGGVWRGFPPQSEFLFKDCTFTDNTAENGDGGCFYFPGDGPSSNITIDGGTFTGNKSGSSGGAFRANLNGGTVTVKGGAVFSGNSADVNAGAFSVRRKGAGYYGTVQLLSAQIIGNHCNANFDNYKESDLEPTKHYNTGGVYIGENITCYMYDALVTGNRVESGYTGSTVGNGIALCPNAQVFLYPEHGAMIYGNGTSGMDIVAVPYDETINHETPAKLYVSSTTPTGEAYHWTDLNGNDARTGGYDWTNARSGIATVSALDDGYHSEMSLTPVGFKANIQGGIMPASADGGYSVIIQDNTTAIAAYGAGGMMVNGTVIAGEFDVNVEKKVEVKGNPTESTQTKINSTEFKFRFSIIDTGSSYDDSNLKAPEDEVDYTYTTGTGKNGKLKFNEGTINYEGTDRKYIYCDFSVIGQDTVNIGKIKKEDIGIGSSEHYYRFLLEETDNGGANNVTISPEDVTYGSDYSSGAINEFKFIVTNTFEFGELDLTKKVDGPAADENGLWTFNIELKSSEEGLSGTYPVELHADSGLVEGTVEQGGIKFEGGKAELTFNSEGKASVQLKHGQTLKIKNLPVGVDYIVTEDTADNYTTEPAEKATGKTSTTASNVTFTNTRKTGSLTVSKTVEGTGGDKTKAWKFTIDLKDGETPVNGEFTVEGTPAEGVGSSVSGGKITFTGGKATVYLTHGQTITIKGLPVGTTYTVTEADDGKTPYETTKENENGGIKADEKAEAKFTNTAQAGSLTITKTLAGNGAEADKEWHFTVKLTPPAGFELAAQYSYTGTNGVVPGTLNFKESGDAYISAEFALKGGQSLTITGLPVGTEYDVDEKESGANGYNTTATDTGTIEKNTEARAEFTNTRYAGDLAITKTVEGNGGDKTKAWTFTITLTPKPTVTLDAQYDYEITGVEPSSGKVDVDAATGAVTLAGGGKVALKDGQTITIKGLPVETGYTVTEDEANEGGYTTTSSGDEGSITRETTAEAAFTNTRYIGDLKISKTVAGSGGDQNKAWKFTITLKNGEAPVSGTFAYEGTVEDHDGDSVDTAGKNITFADGVATVYLKHGQSITVKGVLVGTTYTVTEEEANKNGYTTEATGESGDIKETPTAEAAFTNTRYVGDLKISKTVAGSGGDQNKAWKFTITLKNGEAPVSGTYAFEGDVTAGDGDSVDGSNITFDANGVATVYLKHGQSITVKGVLVGTAYTVTEEEANKDGYTTEATGASGDIKETPTAEAKFTNTRYVGSLAVSKKVDGAMGDPNKDWHFAITLKAPAGETLAAQYDYAITGGTASNGKVAVGADGKVTLNGNNVTLKHGQTITITGLPVGTTYTVTEDEADKDDYGTAVNGANGAIEKDKTAQVQFTNTKPAPKTGDLTVSKTVAGSGDKSREFTFTVTLTPPEGKTIGDMSDTYPVEGPGTATGELKFTPSADGKAYVSDPFKLKDGESLTVKGILAGSGYTVTEEEADKDGYTTEAAGESGTIPADSAAEAKFTNTKPTPDETPAPSATPPAAPETGDNGRPGLWLALTVLTALGAIAAGAALAVRRRRFGSGK